MIGKYFLVIVPARSGRKPASLLAALYATDTGGGLENVGRKNSRHGERPRGAATRVAG